MNDLEKRLSEWRPSTRGLDADAMLFAAGRDSARSAGRGWVRIAWPVISGCLALLAAALGVGLVQERTAREDLIVQLHNQKPAIAPAPIVVQQPGEAPLAEPPGADSYLAARQALTNGLDSWPVLAKVEPSVGPPPPSRPILKANSQGDVLEP
jgi:hypothetical protein